MKTPRELYVADTIVYTCELETCPRCGAPLVGWGYVTGPKTVQTMTTVLSIAHRPKRCSNPQCPGQREAWKSASWLQIAPWYGTYGYDVIAQIGWQRQTDRQQFARIQASLHSHLQISESEVRRLYHYVYLPLLACLERQQRDRVAARAAETGLLLALDGLAPEGGEPQLWVVREVQTGLTLRAGWLSGQDEASFRHFLLPIREAGWRVVAVLSDKQRGLLPAVATVFPEAKHAFCQVHYLQNAATPIAETDAAMKVTLRKQVRGAVGALIRSEKAAEGPGVLTVTGLLPSPVPGAEPTLGEEAPPARGEAAPAQVAGQPDPPGAATPSAGGEAGAAPPPPEQGEREAIVQDLLRRVRYLLTLKGRPPLRLAGIETFAGLRAVVDCLDHLLAQAGEPRLRQLRQGLDRALQSVRSEYTLVQQAAGWLQAVAEILDPEGKPPRSGEQVRRELWTYLDQIREESADHPRLGEFSAALRKVSLSYEPGLFYTYDIPGLPRTNNGRESEFRDLTRRLLTTTGQKGLVRRTIQREGAWELIPSPPALRPGSTTLFPVDHQDFLREQQRVRNHRARFRLHTRSVKQSSAQLKQLEQRWAALPTASGP